MMTGLSQASRKSIAHALIIAGVSLQATIVLKVLTPDPLSPEFSKRLLGVLMGAFIVFYASASAKTLRPLAEMRCDPRAEQATRRFVGWSVTLGGLAYAMTWMIAPLGSARGLAMSFLGASVLVVLIRLFGKFSRR
jgi:hypothetical protein